MDVLTPDQARALWDAGGFALLTGLPQGCECGIDGTFHAIKSFAGTKFVPPGLHLVVWSPASDGAEAGPGALPLRSAYIHTWAQRERVALAYTPGPGEDVTVRTAVDDAEVRGLDAQLAPYPFSGLGRWKVLTSAVTPAVLTAALGSEGRVDGLTPVEGEEEGEMKDLVAASRNAAKGNDGTVALADSQARTIKFPRFDLRRSWADGATGAAVTKWSKDKSVLWAKVTKEAGGAMALLGHLQLAFLLVSQVWSFGSLSPYKRMLALFCQATDALVRPESHGYTAAEATIARDTTLALVHTLAAQLDALPETAFEAELPDMDVFYLGELDALRRSLGSALGERAWWGRASEVRSAWSGLEAAAKRRGWDMAPLPMGDEDSEDEDKDGEFAPVVVEVPEGAEGENAEEEEEDDEDKPIVIG